MNRPRSHRRNFSFCGITVFVLVAVAFSLFAQRPARESRRALFDGKDLDGWQQVGPGSFVVQDGMMKTDGGMGMLWYTCEKIAHTTIRVVFKLTAKESDSGVFIRIPKRPTEPWMPINRGYEVEIGDWPDDYSCTGVLYTFTKALARPIKPIGDWNTMDITVDGPHTASAPTKSRSRTLPRDKQCDRSLRARMIPTGDRGRTLVLSGYRIIRDRRCTSRKCRWCRCRGRLRCAMLLRVRNSL